MATRRTKVFWAIAGTVLIVATAAATAGPIMSRVEQPEYTVASSKGSIEIREYGPLIAAEAEVNGERQAAINQGFRLIASYIFGANKPNAKIEMTAPVQQEQTIAMTAPVTQQGDGQTWKVRFIMPKKWTMETLPAPDDTRVKLVEVPAKRMVSIQFTWTATADRLAEKTAELREYAREHDLTTLGEPLFAFYNPPWTLPFLRRNEIMLELTG